MFHNLDYSWFDLMFLDYLFDGFVLFNHFKSKYQRMRV